MQNVLSTARIQKKHIFRYAWPNELSAGRFASDELNKLNVDMKQLAVTMNMCFIRAMATLFASLKNNPQNRHCHQ